MLLFDAMFMYATFSVAVFADVCCSLLAVDVVAAVVVVVAVV